MKASYYHFIFRVACAMCYIGHGLFGFITKKVWCTYFAVAGIGEPLAYTLMPVVGAVDVALGLIVLFYPLRFAAVWLVGWGVFTASLRPLAGEPVAELIERAGNFGAPFILLLLSAPVHGKKGGLMDRLVPDEEWKGNRTETIQKYLQLFGFLLLLGHGWLNLLLKPGLLHQYARLGFAHPERLAFYIGLFECIAACVILLKPSRPAVLIILIWKVVSEIPYPAYAILEWIERGGSYAILLGLFLLLKKPFPLHSSLLHLHHTKAPSAGL